MEMGILSYCVKEELIKLFHKDYQLLSFYLKSGGILSQAILLVIFGFCTQFKSIIRDSKTIHFNP